MISHDDNFAAARAREFAWNHGRVYLNAASYGPLPDRSRSALADFHTHRWQADLTDRQLVAPLNAARASAARLIGADADEIALAPNTNIGINIAATAALALSAGRRVIVIHDREFPANVYPWLSLEDHGFRIEIIATDADGLPREDALLERIARGDVAAASVSFVQFASGYRANLNAIGEACRETETLFVVDAIQGLGAVPFDVRACGADILACGGQKWLCSPWGSGFTFVRRDLIPRFEPLLPGWLSFEATQVFTQLLDYRYDLLDDARRFETGSLAYQDYLGLQLGIDLLLELGVDRIWEYLRTLQQPLIQWANERSVPVISSLDEARRSGVLCIRPRDAEAACRALDQARIRVALRESSIRISAHWYNTGDDIARVIEVLDRHIGQ